MNKEMLNNKHINHKLSHFQIIRLVIELVYLQKIYSNV